MNPNEANARDRKLNPSIRRKLLLLAGSALLVLGLSAQAAAQAAAATQPAPVIRTAPPSTGPAGGRAQFVSDGVAADGKLHMISNKTTVLTTTRPYKSVSTGNAEVADVTPVGPTNLLVTAKKAGTTQLILWDDANRSQVIDVTVAIDLEALQGHLAAMFPNSNIEVSTLNGAIALRGRVPDAVAAEQALSAASSMGTRVLNFLELGGGQQVMLQVRFAEVSRQATSALGVNFAASDGIFSIGSNVGGITPSGFIDGSPGQLGTQSVGTGVTLFGSGQVGTTAFRYFISALRQNNLLRVLAEPNLVAISGQQASFLAGGEFPVPVPQSGSGGAAVITIEYREFGVRLSFVPVVLGDGRIRLKMTPEVSDLDFSSPIVISGSRIPIVNKRKVETTIEIADGQTFSIAGLLNNNIAAAKDVTPVLGDLPVLGSLFRSVRYQRKETELVVLVTPKLVAPMNPTQVPGVPGEKWRHPTEAELFLNQDIGGELDDVPVAKAADAKGNAKDAPATGGKSAPAQQQPAGPTPRYQGRHGFTPPAHSPPRGVQ